MNILCVVIESTWGAEVRANRIDASIVDKGQKRVLAIDMFCHWLDNREVKEMKKTQKYGPLMWELRKLREILATKWNSITSLLMFWGDIKLM